MNKTLKTFLASLLLITMAAGLAHETQTVGQGEEQHKVSVGYTTEPAYTGERNGLALTVRTGAGALVENLANSLTAELTAPTGEKLSLTLRAVHGQPGSYTDDFVLTQPGVYRLTVSGFIGAAEVNLTFDLHEVAPIEELRFP